MAELRPHLAPATFVSLIRQLMSEGYRLGFVEEAGEVVAVAGYRISTNLFLGKNLYVDDLVTANKARSKGFGRLLLAALRDIARQNDCNYLHLDSGVQRHQAHKFYFREGMTVSCFHFDEKLNET